MLTNIQGITRIGGGRGRGKGEGESVGCWNPGSPAFFAVKPLT